MTSYIRYGQGIDRHTEILNLASDIGLVHKAGAWFTLTTVEDKPKFQGAEKLRQYLIENPKTYEDLVKSVKETMGISDAG
jgi:recombination protein RecA